MTSLSGNLSSGDLANIFQMLALNQKEGTLYIRSDTGTKAIYFTRNGVQMQSSGNNPASLGRILLRFGRVTEERLQYALDQQERGDGRRLGEVLTEIGAASESDIERALRTQIEEEIYNLFIWKDAHFEFKEGPPGEGGEVDPSQLLTFNVNSIIMESARRMDEWEHIQELVPSTDVIYQYTGTNVDLEEAIFQQAWAGSVLQAIDGKRSIDELVQVSYANRFDVCSLIGHLVRGNAVAPLDTTGLKSAFFESARNGDTYQAAKFLEQLQNQGQDNPKMHAEAGRLLEGAGELRKATEHFTRFAEAQAEAGNPVKAFETYQRIVDSVPTNLTAGARLADLYTQAPEPLGQHRDLVMHWGRTVAAARAELRQHDQAATVLERLVSIDPNDAELHNRLAQAYLNCGRDSEAVAELEGLAAAAADAGDTDRSEKLLQNILLVQPDRRDIRNQLQQLNARRHRRRASWKQMAVGAVVLVVLAVGGWYGWNQWQQFQWRKQETINQAQTLLNEVNEDYANLAPELRQMQQKLLDARRDVRALPEAFTEHLEWRKDWKMQAEAGIDAFRGIETKFSNTKEAARAENAAIHLENGLREIEKHDEAVIAALTEKATEHFTRGAELASSGQSVRDQFDSFYEALRYGGPCMEWMESTDGVKCQQHFEDLRQAVEGFTAAQNDIARLVQENRHDEAHTRGANYICTYPRLDLAGEMSLPLRIESHPPGARVFLDGTDLEATTPAEISVVPYKGGLLQLRSDGFEAATLKLEPIVTRDSRELRKVLLRSRKVTLQRRVVWSTPPLAARLVASPVFVEGLLVMPSRSEETALIDAATGVLKGKLVTSGLDGLIARPFELDAVAVLPTLGGGVEFFELIRRKRVGRVEVDGQIRFDPVRVGAMLVVPGQAGRLTAIDMSSRKKLWSYPIPGRDSLGHGFVCAPVHVSGDIYAVTDDGGIHRVQAESGVMLQRFVVKEAPSDPIRGLAAGAGDLFLTSRHGRLLALDRRTGAERWSVKLPSPAVGNPIVYGGQVIVVTEEGVVRVHATADSKEVGRFEIGAPIAVGASLADGVLYIGDANGVLRALDITDPTPRELWQHQAPKTGEEPNTVTTVPAVTDELVLFGCRDRILRALQK